MIMHTKSFGNNEMAHKSKIIPSYPTYAYFYSNMDKRLLGVFLIFGKWPLKF